MAEVGTAISLAVIPTLGVRSAVLVIFAANLSLAIINADREKPFAVKLKLFLFNNGMHSIAIFLAGTLFLGLESLFAPYLWLSALLPWLPAATLYSIINLGLLTAILRLQNGASVNVVELMRENLWASGIDILIMGIGGGFLGFAISQYDILGIIIFFLPILLSAFAFRLYVTKMQAHLNNLESIVAERTDSLQQLMREKDQFLAVLTHDMKTPLTTIKLYGSMLAQSPELLTKKPHIATSILDSQQNLSDIVTNILELEQLQADGDIPLEYTELQLTATLSQLLTSLSVLASKKDILLLQELDFAVDVIQADRGKVWRIFQNIVSNGIKYTPEGGRVTVRGYVAEGLAIVEIADTGYGIPKDELPFIFDRFRRVEQHKTVASGTGLGLTITKALIEAHGGQIEVESQLGEGTTFTVSLPLQQVDSTAAAENVTVPAASV